jgi:hypothetical protein
MLAVNVVGRGTAFGQVALARLSKAPLAQPACGVVSASAG